MNLEEAKEYLESTLQEDLNLMQPSQRVNLYLNLMEFFTPKKQRTAISGNDEELADDIYTDKSI